MIRCVGGKHEVWRIFYTGTGVETNANGPIEPVNGDWTPVIQYAASFYGIEPNNSSLMFYGHKFVLESGGREVLNNLELIQMVMALVRHLDCFNLKQQTLIIIVEKTSTLMLNMVLMH